jgi:hypothetical protein
VQIVLHARQQGLKFGWVGADAGYGTGALQDMKGTADGIKKER